MKIKNKLRRLNCQQISQLSAKETQPQTLIACADVLKDRNNSLLNKRNSLIQQILDHRSSIEKTVIELKDSMKEKLRCNEKVIVDKNSRPSAQDMKYLSNSSKNQKQRTLCQIKDQYIIELSSALHNALLSYHDKLGISLDTSKLDKEFQSLNKKCQEQLVIRDEILNQRDRLRNHYGSIQGQIEQCRKVYQQVEENIMKAQRELIQLTSYLDTRAKQDKATLDSLRKEASNLEEELLKGQQMINSNGDKRVSLQISCFEQTGVLSF